jgi:predicted transcriptional regulator
MVTKPTQMRIPPELLARIDQMAEKQGVSRTAVVVAACEAWLEDPPSKRKRESAGERCSHPIGRRIGGVCAVCGERP